ncbi:MAG TPA: potassium transporter Kup [Ignavibacteria bacterium]|nr:potassium transporter Kup [Bacteroidota bacterium]HRI85228.1 potassium transporter Kup [Ignavibacteria bacterium]HRK00338.1 potassium transporter Kup [Ignavibacteria bacterium]
MLCLSALGIVFGDIGTSPLYALRECFHGVHGIAPLKDNILGVLSLIFWSLILIISVEYILIIMKADNDGEGGILALMSLLKRTDFKKKWVGVMVLVFGLFGSALLYGDSIITPAISVLSAVEGLALATPLFEPVILPVTILILVILFSMQKRGTSKIGKIFGPITFVWFVTIAILGCSSILENPEVFAAVNPYYAVIFFIENGFHGFVILGAVFLVVTGGEALYADMGHFGRQPIKITWFCLVLPSLLLNYFGQGALLIRDPSAAKNPFYLLAPEWALYPLIGLATFATVIASQAVISGAFSLTFQALQLGYLPRMRILHTSEDERGQIYIPQLNFMLFLATIALVLSFKSSSNLASAYGIAVTTTMLITTMLLFITTIKLWKWNKLVSVIVILFFITIDLSFWGANMLKLIHGGWVPLAIGLAIYLIMTTWNKGRKILLDNIKQQTMSLENFVTEILSVRLIAIPGTAVYMSSNKTGAPPPLILNIKHNRLLHKQIIILTIIIKKVPHIKQEERLEILEPTEGFYRVIANYGYMDIPNIQNIIELLKNNNIKIDINRTTFFLGRETLIPGNRTGFGLLRSKLFILLSNNAQRATEFFNIPPQRVFEVGTQVEL